jgi:hypothetical protein
MSAFSIPRGTTFDGTVTYTPPVGGLANLLGATISSQIIDAAGVRHDVPMTLDETGLVMTYAVSKFETAKWYPGLAFWDLRYDFGSGLGVGTKERVLFTVTEPVTQPPSA